MMGCHVIHVFTVWFIYYLRQDYVKVQREALAESRVVFSRVFGNKMGRRLTVVEEGLFSGIATTKVQVSYTRYTFTCSQ